MLVTCAIPLRLVLGWCYPVILAILGTQVQTHDKILPKTNVSHKPSNMQCFLLPGFQKSANSEQLLCHHTHFVMEYWLAEKNDAYIFLQIFKN